MLKKKQRAEASASATSVTTGTDIKVTRKNGGIGKITELDVSSMNNIAKEGAIKGY